MQKILSVLVVLCGAVIISSTAAAKSDVKSDVPSDSDSALAVGTEVHSYDNQMIQAGQIAEASAHARSHRHCWRAVKDAMVEAAVIDDRPTTKYAKQAAAELEEKYGFKKIDVSDPSDAPVGSVLVYGGHGAGHIEIRTADGFVSDFVSDHPSRRPLIGVYVRI